MLSSVDSCIRSNGIELKLDEASGIEIGVKAVPFRIGPRVAIDVTRGEFRVQSTSCATYQDDVSQLAHRRPNESSDSIERDRSVLRSPSG